jgi:hypothetical protein
MKRVIIVAEGQTEQEFIKECIAPYLQQQYGIYSVSARLIGKPGHKGGNVRYVRLKTDIDILLSEKDVIVSTFIDYFRLATDFPDFDNCQQLQVVNAKINCLEQALSIAINNPRFIPYIQKHEFEALLFSSHNGFEKYLKPQTCIQLNQIIQAYDNPEDINTTHSPSGRLITIMKEHEKIKYDKPAYGNILAVEIGIDKMLEKCPRFANWLVQLASKATQLF